jgi:hypothetical protein
MPTNIIELKDGILIEVEQLDNQVEQISGKLSVKVNGSIDKIKPILLKLCQPIIEAWQEINKEMYIEGAEVELGLGFEGEGNLYITKSKGTANIRVKLILKPQKE